MVRNFPRTTRRRVIAALAAGSLLASFAAIPLASADDLKDRKKNVQGSISKTLKELDQSSGELIRATRALDRAQGKLADAEARLAKTRGQLAVAVVFDRQMQDQLVKAVARLRQARAELVEGRSRIVDQQRVLGQIAVQNYQNGDPALLGLSMVLTSQDPEQLTSQLNSVRSVLDKEAVTLDRLEASRVLLTVKEEEVEEAKLAVAEQRREAAANLRLKKRLERRAAAAEVRISALVSARADAEREAARARAADLRVLRGLQRERDRISDILARRAEAARRRAAAAARAGRGSGSRDGFLSYPVNGYITSPYGMRFHPVYFRWTLHDGVDFGADCGTPVRASAGGRVIAVYYNEGYGNRVIVDNGYVRGAGLGTAYNHLSAYSTYTGQRVERGDVIGYVGNTGYSTGCHLHFMVFENGATVDPMGWL